MYIRADQYIFPQINPGRIENRTVIINKTILTSVNIESETHQKGACITKEGGHSVKIYEVIHLLEYNPGNKSGYILPPISNSHGATSLTPDRKHNKSPLPAFSLFLSSYYDLIKKPLESGLLLF